MDLDLKLNQIIINTTINKTDKINKIIEILDDSLDLYEWTDDNYLFDKINSDFSKLEKINDIEVISKILISKLDSMLDLEGNGWYSDSYEWIDDEITD